MGRRNIFQQFSWGQCLGGLLGVAGLISLVIVTVAASHGGVRTVRLASRRADSSSVGLGTEGLSSSKSVAATSSTVGGSGGSMASHGLASGASSVQAQGGSQVPSASNAAVSSTPGVTATSILIGGSTFLSGPAAVYGQQLAAGLQASFDVINAEGGVNGRKLKLILYNDEADPATQFANVQRLVDVDHVFALAMVYAPGQQGAWIASHGVPVVTEGQYNQDFTNPWFFPTGAPQGAGSAAIVDKAAELGAKDAAVFYLNAGSGNYSASYAQHVAADFQSMGVHVGLQYSMSPTQTQCTSGMTQAAADHIDFIDFEMPVGQVIPCVLSAQEMNYIPAKGWGGYLIGVPATPQGIGAYSEGMWAVDAFAPIYASATYQQAVAQVNSSVEADSSPTAAMYVAGFLLADGIQRLGNDITRQGLVNVLDTFTNWVPPGVPAGDSQAPVYTFRPDCHVGLGSFYYIQVRETPSGNYAFEQASPYLPLARDPASSNPLYTCRQSEP